MGASYTAADFLADRELLQRLRARLARAQGRLEQLRAQLAREHGRGDLGALLRKAEKALTRASARVAALRVEFYKKWGDKLKGV